MVRTRKRTSPKVSENPDDPEEKKPKLDATTSKYFESSGSESSSSTKNYVANINKNEQNSSDDEMIVAKAKRITKIEKNSDSDSDDSSSDEFMKAPFSLDDLGDFKIIKKEEQKSNTGVVCSSSVSKLSDDSGDEKNQVSEDYYDFSQIIKTQQIIIDTKKEQEEKASLDSKLKQGESKNKKICKKSCKKRKIDTKSAPDNDVDISKLLAMAEGGSFEERGDSDSEEENEEVKEIEYSLPKEGVQVTIELPNHHQKKKRKGFDVEAAMKRRINLVKKENQVLVHKVHLLCWISHCVYLNRIINKDEMMGLALSLIPSNHCYPPKHTDLNYLEKLVEWFVAKINVNPSHKLAPNSLDLPLLESLETQIELRTAFSLRDLVVIFTSMVRSLGINARLVVSMRVAPLRPPASELCSLSTKPKQEPKQSAGESKSPKVNKKSETSKTSTSGKSNSKQSLKKDSKIKNDTLKSPELKSPYFSSSDEVPLKELVKKNQNKKGSTRSQNLTEATSKDKTSKIGRKPNTKTVTDSPNKSSKSIYFNSGTSQSTTKTNSKLTKLDVNNEKIKEELKQRRSSVRRSVSKTQLQEWTSESSDDEVEIALRKKTNKSAKTSPTKSPSVKSAKGKKEESQDRDFLPPKPSTSRKKSIDRRVLSSDDDSNPKKKGNDYWTEVFLEAEEKWISVDLKRGKVHCVQQLYSGATQPVRYVIACNSDGTMKDVTRRYAPHWLTVTRKQRVDTAWWNETFKPYAPRKTLQDRLEDEDLDQQLHDKPLPTSVTEYKNHPLYALKRHLLKFEAIYPPDAPPLGFVRGEPVYSRGCVAELHTRETWIKEAKLVRRDEQPYKIVKARPKWDKLSQTVINDLPLPLFGHWQVEDYIPPPAVDGKVPRNEYGNVELYKPCMLPPGTVHLQVPQLARVARKLGIDCAPAVVGWEFSGGGSHPVLDGFIVCEEFKDVLLDAWDKEMDESAKRAKDKVEARVYGNWKRLIKGLLIRERLKMRYDFGDVEPNKGKKKKQPKASTSRKS